MDKKRKPTVKSYICTDCNFIFQVFKDFEKRRFYCPNCSDQIAVKVYKKIVKKSDKNYRYWSNEEKQDLELVLAGNLKAYQFSEKHKRTAKAVRNALSERRKELNI